MLCYSIRSVSTLSLVSLLIRHIYATDHDIMQQNTTIASIRNGQNKKASQRGF